MRPKSDCFTLVMRVVWNGGVAGNPAWTSGAEGEHLIERTLDSKKSETADWSRQPDLVPVNVGPSPEIVARFSLQPEASASF